jgi:hypothetical protein
MVDSSTRKLTKVGKLDTYRRSLLQFGQQPWSSDMGSSVVRPKSASRALSPLLDTKMFSGLRSLWRIPKRRQCSTASKTRRDALRTRTSLFTYLPLSIMRENRSPSGQYSRITPISVAKSWKSSGPLASLAVQGPPLGRVLQSGPRDQFG